MILDMIFINDKNYHILVTSSNDDGVNKLYMRYAEVVLMAAETENELKGPAEAAPYLKMVGLGCRKDLPDALLLDDKVIDLLIEFFRAASPMVRHFD